jgi:hypothetical protein
MLQPTEADGLCEPVTAGAASLLPEPVTAATFDSLGDDAVATVLSWVSFADLLCLKIVSIHLCKLSRRALTTGPRFEISRKMSESLSKEGYDAPNESRHDTHFYLEMCRAKVLLEDDVDNLASLLHNGLLSVVKPLKMGRSLALPNGVLPLHMAHSAEAVRLLVDVHGAVVDAQRADGKTALMDACVAGEAAVVAALCERGADVNLRCANGDSCLHHAKGHACSAAGDYTRVPTFNWRGPVARERGAGIASTDLPPPDGAACVRLLHAFGVPESHARITRGEWFYATDDGDVPDEYMPAFH